jgi:lysophospholipase L1-like esterase
MKTNSDKIILSLARRAAARVLCFLLLSASSACAASAPRPFIIHQPIEDADGHALAAFYHSLARTHSQREIGEAELPAITRILHYGDSHVAADILTGALRRYFQRDFGDAGPGFIFAGHPWSWYAPGVIELSSSSGWQRNELSQAELGTDGRFGLSGVSFSTGRAGESIRLISDCARFEIYLLKQPGGGAIDVSLDGEIQSAGLSLASEKDEPEYLKFSVADESAFSNLQSAINRPHSIELHTVAPGAVRVLGFVSEQRRAGVVYDALGINGARATRLLAWDENVLADNLMERNPDLIIVAYGSNEVGDADFDPAIYRRKFSAVLERLQSAAPRASLLVIAPPDRAIRTGRRWRTISALPRLIAAQRAAAIEAGAAFWNLTRAMGGAGSIARWAAASPPLAQRDRVHLTRAGYLLIADALYAELTRGYQNYGTMRKQ